MREIRHAIVDIDRYLEEAARAQQQHEADQWRHELRPRAIRTFAGRAAKLTWSRALLKLVVEELYPDDLFTELVGKLDRVPARQWPRVLAIAVAPPAMAERDGLTRVARRLHVSLATPVDRTDGRRQRTSSTRPSPIPFSGSPRPRQGSRFARPAKAGSRP